MTRFRRSTSGTTFFFTVVAHRRRPVLCDPPVRHALRTAIERVREKRPFHIDAWTLMPDHLHCIWTLPDGDHDFATRWSLIKHHVSFACGSCYADAVTTASRREHGDASLWQRRFWEHCIRDEIDMQRHLDYTHFNPVRHGLVGAAGQ